MHMNDARRDLFGKPTFVVCAVRPSVEPLLRGPPHVKLRLVHGEQIKRVKTARRQACQHGSAEVAGRNANLGYHAPAGQCVKCLHPICIKYRAVDVFLTEGGRHPFRF
jgi:hypothetical protein